jgi:hypothetical protein
MKRRSVRQRDCLSCLKGLSPPFGVLFLRLVCSLSLCIANYITPCRLRETGVVNVENPVGAALRSGRIEELDSDASDD